MSSITGFAPIVSAAARVLILGTMPSVESLRQQQYYGHPHNAFWPIMARLLNFEPSVAYPERTAALTTHGIALWDVLHSCQRQGSMDADIRQESLVTNDYYSFFSSYPAIQHVFFNGKMAEKLYRKHVLPTVIGSFPELKYQVLPSTSPAFATLRLAQKLEAWQAINQLMVK